MSRDRRPAPVPPPLWTAAEGAPQIPPLTPVSSSTEREGSRRPLLPSTRHGAQLYTGQNQFQYGPSQVHIPPRQPRRSRSRSPRDRISVASLLSSDSDSSRQPLSPPRRLTLLPPYDLRSQTVCPFPTRDSGIALTHERPQVPYYPPITPDRINAPSTAARPFQPSISASSPYRYRPRQSLPSSNTCTDQHQYSPTTIADSVIAGRSGSQSDLSPASASTQNVIPAAHEPILAPLPPLNYNLTIRQQPVAARACGYGERDRRVVDPPPILELKITNRVSGAPEQDADAMLALHCTLLNADGSDEEPGSQGSHTEMPLGRRLMGTLVASSYAAKDEHGRPGTFFVFADLSCRTPDRHRLRFKLLRVDPRNLNLGTLHRSVALVVSDVFTVYAAKFFPGMQASSALLKALRAQGMNVGVKKGTEARKKGRAKYASSTSDSGGEEDTGERSGADTADEDDGEPRRVEKIRARGTRNVAAASKTKSPRRAKRRRTAVSP